MLRYPTIDQNAFLVKWPKYATRVHDVLKTYYKKSIKTMWCKDIESILALLKMLPAKGNGRNLQSMETFNRSIDKLFWFRTVSSSLLLLQFISMINKIFFSKTFSRPVAQRMI